MSKTAQYPFSDYKIYKVFHKSEGRMMAQLVKSPFERTTMSMARYMMCVHLGRILDDSENVDHINDNKLDDRLENFQILSRSENTIKQNKLRPAKYTEFICPICKILFLKRNNQIKLGKIHCCSRECGYIKTSQTLRNR